MRLLNLDFFTFLLLLALGNALTIGIFFLYSPYIKKDKFNVVFVIGKSLQSLAWLLILFRGEIPALLSFQVGNSILSASVFCDALALASARGLISKRALTALFVPAALGALNVWIPFRSQAHIVGLGAFLFMFPYLVSGFLLLRKKSNSSKLVRGMGWTLVAFYLCALIRGIYFLSGWQNPVFTPRAMQVTLMYLFFAIMLVTSLGYILLKKEEVDKEREQNFRALQDAQSQVRTLSGFIPICASCKKIRNDQGFWQHVEEYVREHTDADFSHSICPECLKKLYPDCPIPPAPD